MKGIVILLGIAVMSFGGCDKASELAELVPDEINGWRPAGEDSYYNSENLYDYIDGGAEVYLAFNVQTVFARRYEKAGEPEIVVDIFEMGSSEDAYGVYFHDLREGSFAGEGQDSEWIEGSLFFWKGRYFVSIFAYDETEEAWATVRELGRNIAEAIQDTGSRPELISLLPEKRLPTGQIRYFHDYQVLNKYYFLAEENLLKLNRDTEGILANYSEDLSTAGKEESSEFALLLIRYPSEAETEGAYESFRAGYMPDADEEGILQTENSLWTGARCLGNLLIAVFDAPSGAEIRGIFAEIEEKQTNQREG